jgi:cytochrome c oxidase subunit 2
MKYAILIILALTGCTQAPDDLPSDPVQRGKRLAERQGCLACHTVNGQRSIGPTWKGLFESERHFIDGTSGVANRRYLYESIKKPGAKVVKGYSPVMPSYAPEAADLRSLVLYIESLK